MTERTEKRRSRLSHEILGLLAATLGISFFLFQFLSMTAGSIADNYMERNAFTPTEGQLITIDTWIFSLSLGAAVLFFITLFLILLGQKIAYIRVITQGVEALKAHRMDYEVPVEGDNELTRLAEAINYLSAAEREIQEQERQLSEEKESFIRTMSHDIRTPLTSIMSYSELMRTGDTDSARAAEYAELILKKARQIREMTDALLDGGQRTVEYFDNARFLMEQLAEEFEEMLEDAFTVECSLSACPAFSGSFDVQAMRRLFDNLASNIRKYADPESPVHLDIACENGQLIIRQDNKSRPRYENAESYHMGIKSIRRIAQSHAGQVEVRQDEESFAIEIVLAQI